MKIILTILEYIEHFATFVISSEKKINRKQ